jgi:hypothetical protein
LQAARRIVAADDDTVTHHRAPKEFGNGILLRGFERCDSQCVRELRHGIASRSAPVWSTSTHQAAARAGSGPLQHLQVAIGVAERI